MHVIADVVTIPVVPLPQLSGSLVPFTVDSLACELFFAVVVTGGVRIFCPLPVLRETVGGLGDRF